MPTGGPAAARWRAGRRYGGWTCAQGGMGTYGWWGSGLVGRPDHPPTSSGLPAQPCVRLLMEVADVNQSGTLDRHEIEKVWLAAVHGKW